MKPVQSITAIVPCSDLDESEAFYNRLGFSRPNRDRLVVEDEEYRILYDANGASIHLTKAVPGWLVPGQNPFALYYYCEDVDGMAEIFEGAIIEADGPEEKPWGMYEFAVPDPDSTLVRIGWPAKLRG